MNHHDRLPMPFERARSQLLVGQLQRRRRRTQPARDNLCAAAAVFEEIGSPMWTARAQRELARLTVGSDRSALTDSERQIAERAAVGQSNKQIASTLFLSTKTVEMHLSRAYRKLGIRSRAQLADQLRKQDLGLKRVQQPDHGKDQCHNEAVHPEGFHGGGRDGDVTPG